MQRFGGSLAKFERKRNKVCRDKTGCIRKGLRRHNTQRIKRAKREKEEQQKSESEKTGQPLDIKARKKETQEKKSW